jgi:translation initiation factor 1
VSNGDRRPALPKGTVYVTGVGRTCPGCGAPIAACTCAARAAAAAEQAAAQAAGSGAGAVVKLFRDKEQRAGKVVTRIEGLPLSGAALDELLKELKRKCGAGGTRREQVLEIQGDQREKLAPLLEQRGYVVKRVGG